MMYLGNQAVGLNQLLVKNIPLKWDIVEYIAPSTSARTHEIFHNLGTVPDICLIVPDTGNNGLTGQFNPVLLFCTNGINTSYNRLVNNFINSNGDWEYTANPNGGAGYYYTKDTEKITVYAGGNSTPCIHPNEKYYVIFIKFNT